MAIHVVSFTMEKYPHIKLRAKPCTSTLTAVGLRLFTATFTHDSQGGEKKKKKKNYDSCFTNSSEKEKKENCG